MFCGLLFLSHLLNQQTAYEYVHIKNDEDIDSQQANLKTFAELIGTIAVFHLFSDVFIIHFGRIYPLARGLTLMSGRRTLPLSPTRRHHFLVQRLSLLSLSANHAQRTANSRRTS